MFGFCLLLLATAEARPLWPVRALVAMDEYTVRYSKYSMQKYSIFFNTGTLIWLRPGTTSVKRQRTQVHKHA